MLKKYLSRNQFALTHSASRFRCLLDQTPKSEFNNCWRFTGAAAAEFTEHSDVRTCAQRPRRPAAAPSAGGGSAWLMARRSARVIWERAVRWRRSRTAPLKGRGQRRRDDDDDDDDSDGGDGRSRGNRAAGRDDADGLRRCNGGVKGCRQRHLQRRLAVAAAVRGGGAVGGGCVNWFAAAAAAARTRADVLRGHRDPRWNSYVAAAAAAARRRWTSRRTSSRMAELPSDASDDHAAPRCARRRRRRTAASEETRTSAGQHRRQELAAGGAAARAVALGSSTRGCCTPPTPGDGAGERTTS